MTTVSYLDSDVNLHTCNSKGQWQTRETDGRFVRKNFSMKQIEKDSQEKTCWHEEQIAKYGDVLFA